MNKEIIHSDNWDWLIPDNSLCKTDNDGYFVRTAGKFHWAATAGKLSNFCYVTKQFLNQDPPCWFWTPDKWGKGGTANEFFHKICYRKNDIKIIATDLYEGITVAELAKKAGYVNLGSSTFYRL